MKTLSSMKQTAVEWLEEQMKTWGDLPRWQRDEIIQQAKEMEKEQIIEAFKHGDIPPLFLNLNAEQYYNETFKSE
jgi:hypothetical protein